MCVYQVCALLLAARLFFMEFRTFLEVQKGTFVSSWGQVNLASLQYVFLSASRL